MKIKSLLLSVLFPISTLVPTAHAASLTVTTTGKAFSGYEWSYSQPGINYFNSGDYTLTTTFEPAQFGQYSNWSSYGYNPMGLTVQTLTINSMSWTFSFLGGNFTTLSNGLTSGLGSYDQLEQQTNGYDNTKQMFVQTLVYLTSYQNPLNLGLGFAQNWSYSPQDNDAPGMNFYAYGNDGALNLHASIDTVSISGMAAVPEPETYPMLLAGLSLLSFASRRRKKII